METNCYQTVKLRCSCQNECLKNKIMNKDAKFQVMYMNG